MTPLTDQSDLDLLTRFSRENDAEAFRELTRRLAPVAYAACNRVLRDPGRAEEVTQEAFFALVRHAQEVNVSPAGWLHRTATQMAIDVIRSDTQRRRREQTYARRPAFEASSWSELSPLIDQALQSMPLENRDLLTEHFLAGRTQLELAQRLKVSPATLSRRMQCALEQLRAILRDRGVIVAPVLLAGWLTAHMAAPALSKALTGELGKMALAGGLIASFHLPASVARTAGVAAFAVAWTAGRTASAAAWTTVAGSVIAAGVSQSPASPAPALRDEVYAAKWLDLADSLDAIKRVTPRLQLNLAPIDVSSGFFNLFR